MTGHLLSEQSLALAPVARSGQLPLFIYVAASAKVCGGCRYSGVLEAENIHHHIRKTRALWVTNEPAIRNHM